MSLKKLKWINKGLEHIFWKVTDPSLYLFCFQSSPMKSRGRKKKQKEPKVIRLEIVL